MLGNSYLERYCIFEIQAYYIDAQLISKADPKYNFVYSRNNLPRIKDGEYVINIDSYANIGTHWAAIHVKNDPATCSDSFEVEHIPTGKKFIENKIIQANIHKIHAYDSIVCGYFFKACIY